MMHLPRTRKKQAIVLILCIWLLIVLVIAVMKMVYSGTINMAISADASGQIRAQWAARSGVDYAISVLLQDETESDSSSDLWYDNEALFMNVELNSEAEFSIYRPASDGVAYGISDESAKINLFTMASQLQEEDLAEFGNLDLFFTDKESYNYDDVYRSMQGANLRETATAMNIPVSKAFGEDINLNGILDWNEDDGPLSFPPDNADHKLLHGLLHSATVYSYNYNTDRLGASRININTASRQELLTLPGITSANVLWIEANRPFETIAELFKPGISAGEFQAELLSEQQLKAMAISREAAIARQKQKKPEPIDTQVIRVIYDNLTVSDSEVLPGLININTAEETVLALLPGIDRSIADKIIARRNVLPYGYGSPAEIFGCGAIKYDSFIALVPMLTTRSSVFTIHSKGVCRVTGRVCYIEAVIERNSAARGQENDSGYNILFWKQE